MTPPNFLRRRSASNPARTVETSGPGLSLPSDVLLQTCRRVAAVGMAFTVLWGITLLLFLVAGPHAGPMPDMMVQLWPTPGAAIAVTGLLISVLLFFLAGQLSGKPEVLLNAGSAWLVLTSLLFGILEFWVPRFDVPHPGWIGIAILAYSSIVPNKPSTTLTVGLLAATMGPMGLIVTRLRGVSFEANWFEYLLAFLLSYICAGIAVIPAKIIRGLGQEVRRARELGSYRLNELLGQGGMGEVYRASHQLLARPAAVKLIRTEAVGAGDPAKARVMIERFRREAEAAASLRSPHTINLYDFGVAQDGTFFFVMELLDGVDLESLVRRYGPVPPERAVHLLRQACCSLEEAHARGLIHRDIKPSNIFTCRMGLSVDFVKVLDFGLVKAKDEGPQDVRLTAPNHTTGTPAYIAPEVVLGNTKVDHRVDIYALGCVAYWLVTGQLVFDAPNSIQLMIRHGHDEPVAPSRRTELPIPPALDATILACLAKRPDDRPQSAGELSRRLLAALDRSEAWTTERAERWWLRHHPEVARLEPVGSEGLTLTRTLAEGFAGAPVTATLSGVGR